MVVQAHKIYQNTFLAIYSASTETELEIPLVLNRVNAGFPSPAADFIDDCIDLNKELIKNKATTFFIRVLGDSLKEIGINDGDLLIVDKSLSIRNKDIAICILEGEFNVKIVKVESNCAYLISANDKFNTIKVTAENEFSIWGIVTYSIKKFR